MRLRQRFFAAVAELGLRRPGLVLVVLLAFCIGGGWLAAQLHVSTSRTGLVSDEQPDQARQRQFVAEFGSPDTPVVLVSGGTPEARRGVVDRVQAALDRDPELHNRVLGRLRPQEISSVLLLQRPEGLAQMRASLPPGTDLAKLVEGGTTAWLGAIADQLEQSVGGDDEAEDEGSIPASTSPAAVVPLAMGEPAAPPDAALQAATGLATLAMLARALDDYVASGDPIERFADSAALGQRGLDDRGYLVSGDGENHLIVLYPQLRSDEGSDMQPTVDRIRAIRDEAMRDGPPEVTADVTGLPAVNVDELVVVQQGLRESAIVATIGIILLCWILFRSVFQTIVANLPLLPGVVVTLGAVFLLYGHLNLITSSFVAVLLGLGIDFAVHVVSRFNEHLQAGLSRNEAVKEALQSTGPGILTGAVITAIGFLAGVTTEFTAYAELGVITAIGLGVVALCTFFLVPALIGRGHAGAAGLSREFPGMRLLPGFIRRSRAVLVGAALVSAVASLTALPSIAFNPRYFAFLPETSESARALLRLEYDPVAGPIFVQVTADSMEEAREKARQLRALDSVAGVQSPADLVPPLGADGLAELRRGFAGMSREPDFSVLARHEPAPEQLIPEVERIVDALDEVRFAMTGAGMSGAPADDAKAAFVALRERLRGADEAQRARLAGLDALVAEILAPAWTTARAVAERGEVAPTDLPPLFASRFVSKDGKRLAIYAIPGGRFWDDAVAEKFSVDVRSVDPEVSGLALTHVAHGRMIMRGFERAAAIATAVILLILVLDLRSLKDALLALFPTAIGWTWMLGLMAVFDLEFNNANIVSLPLVIGVGIAYGVHLMHRIRESEPKPGQSAPVQRARIDDAIRGTGGAIMIAALTTIVGFVSLTITDYGAMKSFGWVMVIGITTSLVATILVLPALLLLIRRAQ
jgi:uncharacterized protein